MAWKETALEAAVRRLYETRNFETFVGESREHWRALASRLSARYRHAPDVDDLVQVMLVTAWRRLGTFDASRGVGVDKYVVWNAYEAAVKAATKAGRSAQRETSYDAPDTSSAAAFFEATSGMTPFDIVSAAGFYRRALARAPRRDREIVEAVVAEGSLQGAVERLRRAGAAKLPSDALEARLSVRRAVQRTVGRMTEGMIA